MSKSAIEYIRRDKLIHHYFGVDYALVWDVVKNELPDLKTKLLPLIAEN